MATDIERDARRLGLGRDLIARWAGVFRSLRLYDWQHSGVVSAAERVRSTVAELADGTSVQLAVRSDCLFLDGLRVREGGSATSSYQALVRVLTSAGIESVTADAEAECREFQLVGHLLLRLAEGELRASEIERELKVRGVTGIDLGLASGDPEPVREISTVELQKRVYLNAIGALKGVFHEARGRDRVNARRVKRVVQQMVDTLEGNSGYLLNLTAVKNYDEYTFNHSVNVGVLAIALGRAVGLSRRQLYVLGQAGMLHDLGKLCVPREILVKRGRLTPEERAIVASHPAEGFLMIAKNQGVSPETIVTALGAYEHHLNLDASGYPPCAAQRPIGLLSRIIAIVDRYDAMTSARVYRTAPIPPTKALSILMNSQRSQIDQTVLRYFLNLLGSYPLGTIVRLSDHSIAIVVGAGPAELTHFPVVKLVLDERGQPASGETVDLSATAKDPQPLRVVETLNAADYGIEALDYIL
jgi:HD-GYP domain-containing protein (c-di-GMP phosphodiesterase class II)